MRTISSAHTPWLPQMGLRGQKKGENQTKVSPVYDSSTTSVFMISNSHDSHRKLGESCSKQIIGAFIQRNLCLRMAGSKQPNELWRAALGMWTHVCRLGCKQTTLQARSQSLSSHWEIYTELNQIYIKSSVGTNISPPGCTSPLCWFCCWSLWGMKGCIHRCSWVMSCHLTLLPPPSMADPYPWMLQPNQGVFPPFPMTLFVIYDNTQAVLIYQDIVHHSITQLTF